MVSHLSTNWGNKCVSRRAELRVEPKTRRSGTGTLAHATAAYCRALFSPKRQRPGCSEGGADLASSPGWKFGRQAQMGEHLGGVSSQLSQIVPVGRLDADHEEVGV
jgi:hypothetical protein